MAGDGRGASRSERAYRILLKAYPRTFREEYGAQMAQAFGDLRRREVGRAGTVGLAALWVRTLADLLVSASAERGRTVVPSLYSPGLIRFGGISAMIGGALGAVLIVGSLAVPYLVSTGQPDWILGGLNLLGVLGTLLLAVGTLGLYACVAVGSRKLATLGLVVASFSALMLVGAAIYQSGVVLTSGYPEGPVVSSVLVGVVALVKTTGFLLLGVALLMTRALGRWSAFPLVLGVFPLVAHLLLWLLSLASGGEIAGVPMLLYALSMVPDFVVNLGWVMLGYLLWSGWSGGAEGPAQPA